MTAPMRPEYRPRSRGLIIAAMVICTSAVPISVNAAMPTLIGKPNHSGNASRSWNDSNSNSTAWCAVCVCSAQ